MPLIGLQLRNSLNQIHDPTVVLVVSSILVILCIWFIWKVL